jgi:hypothetical protein
VLISTAPESRADREPHLAVGPAGELLTAWIAEPVEQTGGNPIGFAFAEALDLGFEPPGTVDSPGPVAAAVDPVVAAIGDGGFYLVWMSVPAQDARQILLSRFDPLDQAFDPPRVLDRGAALDKPWLAADGAGDAWVVWSNFDARVVRLARVGAETLQWDVPTAGHDLASICLDPTRPVEARSPLYLTLAGGAPATLRLLRADGVAPPLDPGAGVLAADATYGPLPCAVDDDRIWLAWAGPASDDDPLLGQKLHLVWSDQGGAQLTELPIAANAGAWFGRPELAVLGGSATLLVHQRGTQGGTDATLITVTPLPDHVDVSSSLVLAGLARGAPERERALGDYMGLAVAEGGPFIVLADNRQGPSRIRFIGPSGPQPPLAP